MSGASPDPELARALVALLPRLRRYARVLAHDPEAADDLVQDTLERAWTRQRQWRAGSDLRAWLFSIMHNRHVDLLRGRAREPRLADPPPEAAPERAAPEAEGPAGNPFDAIDLQRAFERLAQEHRQVLLLVAVEQLSYAETAKALGVPLGTVMSRLSRAREQLRTALDGGTTASGVLLKRIK